MSKSGSRYGRRSNWFKIHCLLQEQQQQQQNSHHQQQQASGLSSVRPPTRTPPHSHQSLGLGLIPPQNFHPPLLHLPRTKEELMLLGFDEYKHAASPSVSSPESHNSDSSVEVSDVRRTLPLLSGILPTPFISPGLLFPSPYSPFCTSLLQPANNNNRLMRNHNPGVEAFNKRVFLDAVLQSQRIPTPEQPPARPAVSPIQEDPIDLSMKTGSDRGSSPNGSMRSGSERTERGAGSDADEESDCDSEREMKIKFLRPTPLDLTTKV